MNEMKELYLKSDALYWTLSWVNKNGVDTVQNYLQSEIDDSNQAIKLLKESNNNDAPQEIENIKFKIKELQFHLNCFNDQQIFQKITSIS